MIGLVGRGDAVVNLYGYMDVLGGCGCTIREARFRQAATLRSSAEINSIDLLQGHGHFKQVGKRI